jgi:hypothetical protein
MEKFRRRKPPRVPAAKGFMLDAVAVKGSAHAIFIACMILLGANIVSRAQSKTKPETEARNYQCVGISEFMDFGREVGWLQKLLTKRFIDGKAYSYEIKFGTHQVALLALEKFNTQSIVTIYDLKSKTRKHIVADRALLAVNERDFQASDEDVVGSFTQEIGFINSERSSA